MMATSKGPGLYEFLIEAELQQYYAGFKNDLKVQNVPQLKYVTEDDLLSIGMSKPEMRRLKKFFQRHFPQNYLSKFKKLILSRKDENHESSLSVANEVPDKPAVKVPNKHIIPAEAIVVNKELGQGEFGTVQQGVWTDEDDRIQVAIKCLSRERMQNNPIEFLKEAAIMHGIDHEHIVRLYGVVLDTDSLMLVTELAPLRSLLECLKEPSLRSNFPVLSLCDFAIQVCDGMQYLEQKRLIHRDLAARNILVFSKNKVKISDFGLSRALGVGKDYYQTNFNVNLKLPIAWCAPECISYLRFTSASDVWAFGVTLWEMFSYGFQPWAALTGHQILEAIDEPNFQRLEQPECCPREYYNIMMKCWQHDPNTRPRFSDLIQLLPECKPEQVQAVQEFVEDPNKSRRDQLVYRVGDVITVLDKQQQTSCWKGVTNSGKTGWFNPAHTVTYLGNNLPSNNLGFTRGDGKNVYSSKRKIRPDMISGPQGDFKHTGHVGFDGAYFGDLSFLGGKNPNLPRQIVTPYKPHEDSSSSGVDSNHTEINRNCTDVSDCTPLLKTQPPESIWAEANKANTDHEYHEISDDEDLGGSPIFKNSGPSLMDEMESVLRSLGSSPTPPLPTERKKPPPPFSLPLGSSFSTPPASPLAEAINVKNELKEMAVKAARRRKQATVKPISAEDEKTLDSAIARANELTAKSMSDIDGCTPPESPHTPASPSKRKFSFRFPSVQKHNSPKPERKNFTEQTACIPDIQSTISPEAKEVYSSLVEQPAMEAQIILPATTGIQPNHSRGSCFRPGGPTFVIQQSDTGSGSEGPDSNPLRMLRTGAFPIVRPKGKVPRAVDKTGRPSSTAVNGIPTQVEEESSQVTTGEEDRWRKDSTSSGTSLRKDSTTSSQGGCEEENPIPLPPRDRSKPSFPNKPRHQRKHPLVIPQGSVDPGSDKYDDVFHPLSSGPSSITGNTTTPLSYLKVLPPVHPSHHSATSKPHEVDDSFDQQIATELDALDDINTDADVSEAESPTVTTHDSPRTRRGLVIPDPEDVQIQHPSEHFLNRRLKRRDEDLGVANGVVAMKPNLRLKQKIAQLNQTATLYGPTSDGFDEDLLGPRSGGKNGNETNGRRVSEEEGAVEEGMRRREDHVSCEDLLEFSTKSQSKSRGEDSDEVRLMSKVLGKEMSSENCLKALNATHWDVYSAIKLARLQNLLKNSGVFQNISSCWDALVACDGDVVKAASVLITQGSPPDCV